MSALDASRSGGVMQSYLVAERFAFPGIFWVWMAALGGSTLVALLAVSAAGREAFSAPVAALQSILKFR